MEKISQSDDDALLHYLDGTLNPIERERIERALQHNPVLRTRLEQFDMVTSGLRESRLQTPSKNFTLSVMSKLDQYPSRQGISVRNGILLLIGVLITAVIASVLVSAGVFDNAVTNIDLNDVDISKKYINTPLPAVQYSGKLIVNIIIFLNLGLGWLVLDRVILKPFFQRRMEASH
jgi:hypothetical protein